MTALLSEIGRRGQFEGATDTVDAMDVAGVEPSAGRLLSVAELQQALYLARAGSPVRVVPAGAPVLSPRQGIDPVGRLEPPPDQAHHAVADGARSAPVRRAARPAHPATGIGGIKPLTTGPAVPPWPNTVTGWVAVVGAHGGAGASTVALALADASAAQGRTVHVISRARPDRCGLLAATSVELGDSDDGHWRRGRRGTQITVDRVGDRTSHSGAAGSSWPSLKSTRSGPAPVTVVDLGGGSELTPLVLASTAAVLVVCRVTVPGVQQAERALSALGQLGGLDQPDRLVLLAAVGPRRWPGVVNGSVGPRVRRLQRDGRVVTVPVDRQLERTGLTGAPLPKAVTAAGRVLLRLLEPALQTLRPVAAAPPDVSPIPRVAVCSVAGTGPWPGDLEAKERCA